MDRVYRVYRAFSGCEHCQRGAPEGVFYDVLAHKERGRVRPVDPAATTTARQGLAGAKPGRMSEVSRPSLPVREGFFRASETGGEARVAIQTTVVGAYPKPPAEGGSFTLRKTLHAVERGEATQDDLKGAREALVREVIAEQQDAGIDLVTDGGVWWDDIVTPFARHMSGFEIGGLLRFFDNNVYYRRPVCTGPIEWRGPSSVAQWQFASSVADRPVKAVIPGPVTFARMSVDEHYADHTGFVNAIAAVLAQEAAELVAAGARHLQIDEPALLDAPEDLALARTSLETIVSEAGGAEVTLATYFGDAKRLGADLFTLPAEVFALDLISGLESRNLLADLPSGKKVQAGIVDSRNTKLEDLDALAVEIGTLAEEVGPDSLRVAPSASLEFLPREKAQAKLRRLAEAAAKASTAVGG